MTQTKAYIDRGGTFTDIVRLDSSGSIQIDKVPSDIAIIGDLSVEPVTFGTTVATNALLERQTASTLLIVTEGFGDLVHLGDMTRPSLFEPEAQRLPPLVNRIVEMPGRCSASGEEEEPVDLASIDQLDLNGVESVAIALLNSHRNPAHERAIADRLRSRAPHLYLGMGHQQSAEVGYLARIQTTCVDAAITPVLQRALLRDRVPAGSLAMRSDGSLCAADRLLAPDAVLSGPAGGVLAVAAVAELAGFDHAVGLDMGGTSTDVCRVDRGELPRVEGDVQVAGVRLRRPMLEVHTIAAGGGSILATDGRTLSVGPHSAGANPGPQCYGRGGPPTLTDAALLAGLLDPSAFEPPLDPAHVDLPGEPHAFLAIAREAMASAVRTLATARGIDLRDHALVAYGGAAGQHAAAVAALLGIRTVLFHPCASVLSAWGQSLARLEEVRVEALWCDLWDDWGDVEAALTRMEDTLPDLGEVHRSVDLRHQGTDHAIEIDVPRRATACALLDAFANEHLARYGFQRPGLKVEVVNVRVRARAPRPSPQLIQQDPWSLGTQTVHGPTVLFCDTTAIAVPQGWSARRDQGLLRLDGPPAVASTSLGERTPLGAALWSRRFMSVAEQAGAVLQRLARSVNIRERLDFSCALFDAKGHLVANAPHIPVHLGAMGETVRDLIAHTENLPDHQAWLTNDPQAGGSHLPDLTVVTAITRGNHRWFVASRGHHVDVGGLTPGSMPPHSTHLEDEGIVFRRVPLLDGQSLRDLSALLRDCRDPATVQADLEAQIAANLHAARLLTALGEPDVIATWMTHIQDIAAESVQSILPSLTAGKAVDTIDGIPVELEITSPNDTLVVTVTSPTPRHPTNLNAPPAVVRAAILYGLRVLVGRDIPLNEGALRHVAIHTSTPSLVNPPPDAAVAGGNVETSQRIVDLFLQAAGRMAASQGTMNNLTIGGNNWAFYETIGGGQGASVQSPGCSGRQVHMTNTRATDPEVLEHRLPVRVRQFRLRPNSGGAGAHPGGDGIIREVQIGEAATAALLACYRPEGAAGIQRGGNGLPGFAEVFTEGHWRPWTGKSIELNPGDRVRIHTPGGGGCGVR